MKGHDEMNKQELLDSLKSKSAWVDEIDVWMLGLEAPLEREIMRCILFHPGNVADVHSLVINFVYKKGICTRPNLMRRLDSLVKFGFLKQSEYRGTVFYEVEKEALNGEK